MPPAVGVVDAGELLEAFPCGLVVTDRRGVVTWANEELARICGVGVDELVGQRRFTSLLSGGSRMYFETYVHQLLLLQDTADGVSLTIVDAAGARHPVLVNARRLHDDAGSLLIAVFSASGRVAYEQELLRAMHRAEESEARASAMASALQQTLLPPALPTVPGLDLAAAYRPAGRGSELGGDFYDVFELADGEWAVVIGDVSGKGVTAASITALARFVLRAASVRNPSPAEALRALDDGLRAADTEHFCTAVVLRLRPVPEGWSCRFAIGGHSLPLLAGPGRPVEKVGLPGSLVGVLDEIEFHDTGLVLRPGELLVLCTDGVDEARRDREFFGEDRIAAVVEQHLGDPAGLVHALLRAVLDFQDDSPRDDIAIVALAVPTP